MVQKITPRLGFRRPYLLILTLLLYPRDLSLAMHICNTSTDEVLILVGISGCYNNANN